MSLRLIFAVLPDPTEALDRPARVIGYGFGAGYKDMICTIIPSKTGLQLEGKFRLGTVA